MPTTSLAAVNHWHDDVCARAFWGQQDAPPYRRLLADTAAWLDPQPGERWLDLGCGCGQLTEALWKRSSGRVAQIVALDCAAANAVAYRKLRAAVHPPASAEQIAFVCADFSAGLAAWDDEVFDGATSGLAIQYAESYSETLGRWTRDAYAHLLAEVHRLLRPGGRFVFSVNVPEPAWGKVALHSLHGVFGVRSPGRFLKRAWRMMRYGGWLKREARRGRFHFLPWETIAEHLTDAGFAALEHRLSYARQAYVIRCRKPG
jgi:ubiquinone/menaquinone biosynthesis C-methylase UbiE